MDIQESILDKEATRFAVLLSEEHNIESIRNNWEFCANFIIGYVESSNVTSKDDVLQLLYMLIGRDFV